MIKALELLAMSELFNHFYDTDVITHRINPIYFPRRKKLKGWQKQNRKSTFNKNK